MNYSDLYHEGTAILKEADISEAALDARLLLEYICSTSRNTLLAHPDREVSITEERLYRSILSKRASRIPLQHLTGVQEFMGLDFNVSKDVLIPRQDTEFVVEEALRYIEDGMRVLDMCTGSGCILLSIMNYRQNIEGVGCDISKEALDIAGENAKKLGFYPKLLQGDMFEALEKCDIKKFDVIISNPPYIKKDVIESLMPEVKDHDPYIALAGGDDGLDFYRLIASEAKKYLTNYGRIFLEIGYDQGKAVKGLLEAEGYDQIEVMNDYANNPRVVIARVVNN